MIASICFLIGWLSGVITLLVGLAPVFGRRLMEIEKHYNQQLVRQAQKHARQMHELQFEPVEGVDSRD